MLSNGAGPFHAHPGILVDDQGNPHDLARLIEEVLVRVEVPESEDVRRWLQREFFAFHLQRYSKSRRKAPIYWPLGTPSGSYTLWVYYPSLTSQTLYTAINDFVEPKLKQVGADVTALRNKGSARTRDDEKQFEAMQTFELELIELRDTLLKLAPNYKPNHDDGVQISAAPLWQLFRHKPWQKVLKDTWAKLEKGDYDWAHLAMNYWPERVREKCKTDKSLAIAHGLEDLYVEPEAAPKKARKKKAGGRRMISSVQDYPVSHYFNPDAAQRFFIPKYQREYVWKPRDWEALFNDLEDSPKGHFLGSIICVNNQKDSMAGGRLELIDGQQRFTTISLLFCALYDRLKAHPDPDDDFNVEMVNLKNRLFIKSTNHWRFEPSEQAQNKADFQKVLSDLFPKLVTAPKGLSYFGNRRIAKAYSYFRERLQPLSIEQALSLLDKLKAAVLVKIEVPSHSDAFVLFETINNRGIPLSAIDIIKNNLLAELDKRPDYGIDRAFDEWKDLIDLLPDPAVQERFLRQLYNMFKYLKRIEVKGCTRATRSNLITIYDTLLRKRPVWLFGALQDKGKTYSALLNPAVAQGGMGETLRQSPCRTFSAWALRRLTRFCCGPARLRRARNGVRAML
ncbi:hypothetical protein OJJOAM_002143 [Cupriavidus sp. H18C1]